MKKILGWTVAGIVSIGGFAACGSDEDKSPDTTAASTATTEAGTAETAAPGETTAETTGSGSESSSAIDQFCADAEELVAKIKEVVSNPADPNYAALQGDVVKFTTDAANLSASATPEEATKLQECLTPLSTAFTPGG